MNTPSLTMNIPKIVSLQGKNFIVGLYWSTIEKKNSVKQEANGWAKDLGYDFAVIRDTLNPQAGFFSSEAVSSHSLKGKFYSLAAALSKSVDIEYDAKSWIGLFKIDQESESEENSYYCLAVRDGLIRNGTDFIGTKEECLELCQPIYESDIWDYVFCEDSSLGLTFNDVALTALLPKTEAGTIKVYNWWKPFPLRNISKKSQNSEKNKLIAIIALLGLSAISYGFYDHYQTKKAEEARARAIAAAEAAKATKNAPMPWENLPSPKEVVASCLKALTFEDGVLTGWRLTDVECDFNSNSAVLSYSIENKKTADRSVSAGIQSLDGESLKREKALPNVENSIKIEKPLTTQEAIGASWATYSSIPESTVSKLTLSVSNSEFQHESGTVVSAISLALASNKLDFDPFYEIKGFKANSLKITFSPTDLDSYQLSAIVFLKDDLKESQNEK